MKRETTIETIRSGILGEQYYKVHHKSGVTMLLSPMQGERSTAIHSGSRRRFSVRRRKASATCTSITSR